MENWMFYFLSYYKNKKSNRNHVFEELDWRDKYKRPSSEEILLEVPSEEEGVCEANSKFGLQQGMSSPLHAIGTYNSGAPFGFYPTTEK